MLKKNCIITGEIVLGENWWLLKERDKSCPLKTIDKTQ